MFQGIIFCFQLLKKYQKWIFLVVQWLRLRASTAGSSMIWFLFGGLWWTMPQAMPYNQTWKRKKNRKKVSKPFWAWGLWEKRSGCSPHPPSTPTPATPHSGLGCGLETQVQFTSCFPAHLMSDWEQIRLYRKLHRWTHMCRNMARARSSLAASQTTGKPLNLSGPCVFNCRWSSMAQCRACLHF